ncbi:hypothetical protein [Streptomyces aureus]|uniref:Uncharacterized protein n=1 Tax=Streptomyces aureus TaxID=193461 RepID=A0ABV4SYN4_9ACTN
MLWRIELDTSRAERDRTPIFASLADPDFELPLHPTAFGAESLDVSSQLVRLADEEDCAAVDLRCVDFALAHRRLERRSGAEHAAAIEA